MKPNRPFLLAASLLLLVLAACKGEPGAAGPTGPAGEPCAVVDDGKGTKTITCGGSSPVTVADGEDGTSCTAVEDGDGGMLIRCEDGTVVTVHAGQAAAPCTVADAGSGVAVVRCPDGSSVTYAVPLCGNGILEAGEACDDGNQAAADGCGPACALEAGWSCSAQPSLCLRNDDAHFTTAAAVGHQKGVRAVPTSDQGSLAAWIDQRGGNDALYAQKYDRSGTALWAANGQQVFEGSQQILEFSLAPTLAGGAYLAWSNNVAGQVDVKLQHVRADGTVAFTMGGLAVNTTADTDREPVVVALADGGALVAWWNQGSTQVYVQKVSASGAVANDPAGISVATASATWRSQVSLASTPARDVAYVVWSEETAGEQRVLATRLNLDGTLAWSVGGKRVSAPTSAGAVESYPAAVTSGSSLVVAWFDQRGRGSGSFASVYAQALSVAGDRVWSSDLDVSQSGWASFNNQRVRAAADGAGGLLVSWVDARATQVNDGQGDVYVQRVTASGHHLWSMGGVPVALAASTMRYQQLVSDGRGGAYASWSDSARPGFAQHLSAYGQRLWGDSGLVNLQKPSFANPTEIVVDGSGQPTFFWTALGGWSYGAGDDVFGFKSWTAK